VACYASGALKTMTDWVHRAIDDPAQIDTNETRGLRPTNRRSFQASYATKNCAGMAMEPSRQHFGFSSSSAFLPTRFAGVRYGLTRLFHRQQSALQASDKVLNFKRAVCALNLLILAAMTITGLLVLDQIHPSLPNRPVVLFRSWDRWHARDVALLIVLARTRSRPRLDSSAKNTRLTRCIFA